MFKAYKIRVAVNLSESLERNDKDEKNEKHELDSLYRVYQTSVVQI